jgi:hypothetical protein
MDWGRLRLGEPTLWQLYPQQDPANRVPVHWSITRSPWYSRAKVDAARIVARNRNSVKQICPSRGLVHACYDRHMA